ncbi:MAG: cytochrome c peroxidase [Pseudomonadota bacterium]
MILKKTSKICTIIALLMLSQYLLADMTPLSVFAEKKLTLEQQLGKQLFFDTNLSTPAGQACASCHDIKVSFTEPLLDTPVSLGAVTGRTGTRNTPSVGYAAFSPAFHFDSTEGLYIGGQFLDGRAENLKEQAKGPFLNPDEMNNADEESVITKVKNSSYANLFKQVYGQQIFDDNINAFDKLAQAIAAFESTRSFNQFSSKYDYFLAGRVSLTDEEQKGLSLFEDDSKGNCAACHISKTDDGTSPLFTDFTYDNIGTPSNPEILKLKGDNFIDIGLGETVSSTDENGKFKVPSLRNVSKTAPYMHNGVFTSLNEIVDFYNTRDIDDKWAAPEVATNVNSDELGDLKLTEDEVNSIVTFLHTLTDGYQFIETPTFNSQTAILDIPFIRSEGANLNDKFYAVELLLTDEGSFQLEKITEVTIQDYSTVGSMSSFSRDTGLLELPQLSITNSNGQTESYIAQLKFISKNTDKYIFNVPYLKVLP